ncbi:hypothetical protein [Gelidibacter salicanalis]|uniref:Uncharacterized protein n=1 Tax=Gelidibacter salicanalis TaxID=291193 RepID=A0A934KUG6_9FLAO|nr:hypothetical protein [Gelidibacter salicanalis]MBJ7881576.1 hypothetical protein [Gelidibacter salicanalis]
MSDIIAMKTPKQFKVISLHPALTGKEQPEHDQINIESFFGGEKGFLNLFSMEI